MRVNYLSKIAIASFVGLVLATGCTAASSSNAANDASQDNTTIAASTVAADPCAAVDPCAAADPCAANPCAADPCAAVDPCAAATPPTADPARLAENPNIRYFSDGSGLAIRGTDPVAYFTQGGPVPGKAAFTYQWNNATWRFASAENRDLFAADPLKYAPQYGGFCAWAVSRGYTAPIDPNAWKIVDGKLYLNYSTGVQSQWEQDIPGNISRANANWPGVLSGS